jgi:CDP-ribitol ribitolphosphotransferase
MKAVLFCANPYAFGILKPLHDELTTQGHDVLWYVPAAIASQFPFADAVTRVSTIREVYQFRSDAIFVPGNEVPHYLRGVKVQVFHGLAGEKRGHFRIRQYFDLYLTQGPYFTREFVRLAGVYKNFEVVETGWCKLDTLFQHHAEYKQERDRLLQQHGKKHLVLYAPTFSPSLTSAVSGMNDVLALADQQDIFLLIKFHDLMDPAVVMQYKEQAARRSNVTIVEERNILKPMIMADLMISDTSSVVYEFVLLNKPVITIRTTSSQITWCDVATSAELKAAFEKEIVNDTHRGQRIHTIQEYHPYSDGKSSARMVEAVLQYIARHGVPERRLLNLYRRFYMNRMFGREPS